MTLSQRLSIYYRLTRMDKPIGIWLLLWPTLWALWIAGQGRPDVSLIVIFSLGTFLMRSAGCVINDWADRDFDGHVARTRLRPLAAKEIRPREALYLAAALALAALLIALPLNQLALLLTLPALFLAATYPFTKRFFPLPQAYLGLAFSFGIPMAFAAQTGHIPATAWWLMLANTLWTLAYDTEYALADLADDKKIGIQTSALTFGRYDLAAIMACYGGFFGLLLWIGVTSGRGNAYFFGLGLVLVAIADQYRRIRLREPAACLRAFLANHRIGAIIFVALFIDYCWA